MSARWAYINKSPTGIIDRIYCVIGPSTKYPTGLWRVHFRNGCDPSYLDSLNGDEFYYYEDKNAYKRAVINAVELGRAAGRGKAECCVIT